MKKLLLLVILSSLFVSDAWAAQRYISLAPAATEILFALGLGDQVVGVSSYCDYPPKAKEKEIVGTFSQPNAEKIISLKPDLIFATGLEQAAAVGQLRQLNLKVYVSDPANTRELYASILEIGRLTAKEKQAEALVAKMQSAIEEVSARIKSIPPEKRPKVFVEIWHAPLMTAGSGSFVDELISLAGGRNIASGTKKPYVYFSPEEVIRSNPDCIILGYMDQEPLKNISSRLGWDKISAIKNNRVYNDIDPGLLFRPGPRIVEAIARLHKKFYPQDV